MALNGNNQMLIDASKAGDNEKIRIALAAGADIHEDNDDALWWAANNGRTETVKLLLTLGADIHAQSDGAFLAAANKNHKETMELLLSCGADIHVEGDWAFTEAASNGHNEIVELLLNRCVDVHAGNDKAIRYAAQAGHYDTTILLLRHGADPTAREEDEDAPDAQKGKDAFDGTYLTKWLAQLKPEISMYFNSAKPLREQCFVVNKLRDEVLDACVTGQFSTLIGAPLIASTDKADRRLFHDIWKTLPNHWQDQHQNIYMQFIKEGGTNPVVGQHTGIAQRSSETPDSMMGR